MTQNPDIILAILSCEPTAHCSCRGKQVYSNVVWNPEVDPAKIPSQVDVEAKLVELQTEYDAQDYARNRAAEYPSQGDQNDMMYKDTKNNTTTHADAVEAVKTKWPKDNSGPVE